MVQDYNVTKTIQFIKEQNELQKEVKLTMTHITGHALAIGLHKMRRDIGRYVWGYFKHSKDIGLTCLVNIEGGVDLVPVTIWNGHEMSLMEFTKAIDVKIKRAQAKKDTQHNQSTLIMNYIPSFLAQPLVTVATYLSLAVGVSIKPLGLSPEAFGHVILTNVGGMGYQQGFAPLCPPMRSIGLFAVGTTRKMPWVVDNEIVIQDIMNVT